MTQLADFYYQDERDDCVRACVATILQEPSDNFPYISADLPPEQFWGLWDDELAKRDVGFLWFEFEQPVPLRRLRQDDAISSGYWIAAIGAPHVGPVARHVIVMKGRRHVHDPGGVRLRPAIIHAGALILPRELRDAHLPEAA